MNHAGIYVKFNAFKEASIKRQTSAVQHGAINTNMKNQTFSIVGRVENTIDNFLLFSVTFSCG
jgi:hypothetical protein